MYRDWPGLFVDCNDHFDCARNNLGSWARSCLQELQRRCVRVFGSARIKFIVSYLILNHVNDFLDHLFGHGLQWTSIQNRGEILYCCQLWNSWSAIHFSWTANGSNALGLAQVKL